MTDALTLADRWRRFWYLQDVEVWLEPMLDGTLVHYFLRADLAGTPELATVIPSNPQRTPNDLREPLWNSYFALFAVVGLLTAEWIGRKVIRLA